MYQLSDDHNSENHYGSTLKRILGEYGISVSTLAQRLELPSRNTVHRILSGNGRFTTIERFHDKIRQNADRLHLDAAAIHALDDALTAVQYGERGNAIRTTMAEMIIRSHIDHPCSCRHSTDPTMIGRSLEEILLGLVTYPEVNLLVLGTARNSVCRALQKLLQTAEMTGCALTVQHLLGAEDPLTELRQFLASCGLMDDPRYSAYRMDATADAFDRPGYAILVNRRTDTNVCFIDMIEFLSPMQFGYLPGRPDPDGKQFAYHRRCFEAFASRATRLNPTPDPVEVIRNFAALNEEYASYEHCWSQILIKPDPCIVHIPTDLMMRQIEGSGYLGLSPNAPTIRRLEKVHRRRYENFVTGNHGYLLVNTLSGLRRFMETGFLSDHIPSFPPFSLDERCEILRNLLRIVVGKPGVRLRLLRNEQAYSGAIVNIFDDKRVYVIKSTVGHYQRDMMYRGDDAEMIEIMRRMMINEILLHDCFDDPESLQMVTLLLEEFEAGR